MYDLTGTPGSGNTIASGNGGVWSFSWDTSRVVGGDLLQTARYTMTVLDQQHPGTTATTSIYLKKPEFYVVVSPNPSVIDDYVTLTGVAETGVSYVQIDITDAQGTPVHTFTAPVSADGYFQYGFHINMEPGQYLLQISNPYLNNKLVKVLTVNAPRTPTPTPSMPVVTVNETSAPPTEMAIYSPSQSPQPMTVNGGSLAITSNPAEADIYLDSANIGKTPMTLDNITPGSHTVQIKANGYMLYSVDVTVKTGENITLSPGLVKGTSGVPLSPFIAIAGIIGAIAVFRSIRKKPEH